MPQGLSEADSSKQALGAFGFPCCGPAPFASCAFDIIDIGSQVESRQPFQSPEVGLTQSIMAGHVRNGLGAAIRRAGHDRRLGADRRMECDGSSEPAANDLTAAESPL
jgi:hypothetical protein